MQRKCDVRAIYMGQEEELAEARKCLKSMNEYLHEMQIQCESASVEIINNEKWSQFRGGSDEDKSKYDSPPHRSLLRNIDYSPNSVSLRNDSSNGTLTSRSAATGIILFEVRRLRQSMISAREECQSVKKQLASEVARKIQLNLVIQDMDRRLTATHKGFRTLRQVLVNAIGEGGLLEVMKHVEDKCPGFSAMLHPSIATDESTAVNRTTLNSKPVGYSISWSAGSTNKGLEVPRTNPARSDSGTAGTDRRKLIDSTIF
jgi:hypothetical protein